MVSYEKLYKDAFERARNYYNNTNSVVDAELIELIFPEIAENKRIMKRNTKMLL